MEQDKVNKAADRERKDREIKHLHGEISKINQVVTKLKTESLE